MRLRKRGTRSAVKGQLTIVAIVLMAVVFLILAGVSETLGTTTRQNQQTLQATSAQNLAQTTAAWLTNNLNTQPNYILDGSGPFAQGGTYSPPGGVANATHQFVSGWMQFNAAGHYQACSSALLQPCVRFDPATAYFSTSYNPASTANMATSLQEQNVAATVEVEQSCQGIASACKDSFYSTTIGRRGFYNYLAFTNYATLDPAQYSPLGLTNPGSICQTNNAASGCVPVSYQSNGTPSTNGIFGGGSQTAPVFSGTPGSGLYEAKINANPNLVPDSNFAYATDPINPTWLANNVPGGAPTVSNGVMTLQAGTADVSAQEFNISSNETITVSATIDATLLPAGTWMNICVGGQYGSAPTVLGFSVYAGQKGTFSAQVAVTPSTYHPHLWIQDSAPPGSGTYTVTEPQITVTSTVQPYTPGPLYTSSSNVTLQGWADVPSGGEQGMVAFSGNPVSGFGIGIGTGMETGGAPDMQVMVLYQYVRWIPTGFDVTAGWHQFSLALNASGQPSVYVDGKLVYSDTGPPPNTPTGPVLIGTDGNGGRYYSGAIADVSVYNQTLSASQILDQYNAAAAGTYDAVIAAGSPAAWWKLSEPVGATSAQDSSGNGYTGTYSNPVSAAVPGPMAASAPQQIQSAGLVTGDSLYGALRTNSPTVFVCDGNTSAFDVPLIQATSAKVMTATQTGCGLPSSATTVTQQVSPMAMPTNVSSLDQAAFPYIFPDGTSFDFTPSGINVTFTGSSSYMTNNWPALEAALAADNTVMLLSGSSVTIENMAIPPSGVLYVNGSVSNVVGVVNGQVTIAADGNINVDNQPDPTVGNNLYYYCNGQGSVNPQVIASGCTDMLGLDAQGSIAIGPQQYDQTAWTYYGSGGDQCCRWAYSQIITVVPGDVYTVSADINGSNAQGGDYIGVFNPSFSIGYAGAGEAPETNGVVSTTFVDPAGLTQVRVIEDTGGSVIPAGETVTWSNPVFALSGSSTNLVEPSNQWNTTTGVGTANNYFNSVPAQLPPTVVDAAMTALGNAPGVANSNGSIYGAQWQTPNPNKQNPSCLIDAPDLTINGAMISQYQGTFGQYLGLYPSNPCLLSGCHKHFFWDSRLAYEQPPFALSPGSTNFVETGLVEVSRP